MIRARMRGDDGTVMLLTLGFTVVAMLLVLVVSAATEVHLQRMRLDRVADEVALAASQAIDRDAYYAGGATLLDDGRVPLGAVAVTQAAQARFADAATRARLPQALLLDATTTDGHTVTVTVGAVVHPLFGVDALLPFANGVTLTATSSARAS